MHQLEIQYFFPLTEQVSLDLDYTPCEGYEKEKRRQWLAQSTVTSGQILSSNGIGTATWANIEPTLQFKPAPDTVGYWQVDPNIQVWRKDKPNWLHRKMTKVFFGWEWNDK